MDVQSAAVELIDVCMLLQHFSLNACHRGAEGCLQSFLSGRYSACAARAQRVLPLLTPRRTDSNPVRAGPGAGLLQRVQAQEHRAQARGALQGLSALQDKPCAACLNPKRKQACVNKDAIAEERAAAAGM